MESTSDRFQAVAGSLGVHALVILVLYLGLLQQPELLAAAAEGPAIEATLISTPSQSAAAIRRIEAPHPPVEHPVAPQPQPKPEPQPQDAPKPQQLVPQARIPKPDTVNQDEVRREGELAAQQKLQQEQDERRKQAQLDLSRQQEQQQEESRQRQAQQQLEKDKQLADIRKARADAERQVKLQEEKLKQLANLATQNNPAPVAVAKATAPPAGAQGASPDGAYLAAIKATVNQNWRHDGVPERTHCIVHFTQIPGGEVLNVSYGDCPFDETAKASVEDALKRTPLPYAGFEHAFKREGTIDMCYPEEACK